MKGWVGRLLVFLVPVASLGAAIPTLIESRKNHNEAAAHAALGEIGAAQAIFREADTEGDGKFDYGTLAELGAAGLIDAVLATGTRDGYVFEASYSATTPDFLWFATASPAEPGTTGDRYFCMNHEGVTFYRTDKAFDLNTTDCTIPAGVKAVGR